MLRLFCISSDIGLVWYSAGVGRTGCYTIIITCCTCFLFALILVWFGTALEWGEPVATSSLQYAKSIATLPPFGPLERHKWFFQISSQRVSQKNPVCIYLFRQNPVSTALQLRSSVHFVPPLKPVTESGGFVFALILVWFGTALEWGEPVATPSLQYAARVFFLL